MPVESPEDLAAFFNPEEFGEAGFYIGANGVPQPVTVVRQQGDEVVGEVVLATNRFIVQRAQVPAPRVGQELLLGSDRFRISEPARTASDGSTWTIYAALLAR